MMQQAGGYHFKAVVARAPTANIMSDIPIYSPGLAGIAYPIETV